MFKKLIGACVGLAMMAALGDTRAHAILIDSGISTIDTATGLEWLDLPQTSGVRYNDVAAGFGGFIPIDGYQYATVSQVSTLFTNAGFNFQAGSSRPVDASAVALLLDLLGCTGSCLTNSPFGEGMMDLDVFSPTQAGLSFYLANVLTGGDFTTAVTGASRTDICCFAKTAANAAIGSFLIRPAPEPSTLALFATGLALLAFLGWRRRKAA